MAILAKAVEFIDLTPTIEARAKHFVERRVKPLDALHLACAEEAKVDFFCTCDDKFLKKAKKLKDLTIKTVSPLNLAKENLQ